MVFVNRVICSKWQAAHSTAVAVPSQQFQSHVRVRLSGDLTLCSLLPVSSGHMGCFARWP